MPEGYARPHLAALTRELSVLGEAARYAVRSAEQVPGALRRGGAREGVDPVLLVPGFLAGDYTLTAMSRTLRARGFRTYRAHIRANVGCTQQAATAIEERLERIVERRGTRVQVVGHSLGGMMARGLAVRRPDLVSGIVTMGSPMLAPGAHHRLLSVGVDALVHLSRVGVPGVMRPECVAGFCARNSFEETREPVPTDVGFTAIYSRRDGVVDWRACVDPLAEQVEVRASHLGMALDPRVADHVSAALRAQLAAPSVERSGLRIA